jgi:Na+(H+)/acetate symporter ActP
VLLIVWAGRDGAPAPPAPPEWTFPLAGLPGEHPLFATYSLILATFLGTMGLPHVLVRFYTNPDGRAARTTTLVVLGMLGVFYLFPTVYGALGRVYAPQLLQDGNADAVVLVLPGAAIGGLGGDLLAGLVAAGAFAAFLSTSSGLLVSVSGVLSTDVLGRWSGGHGSVRDFRRSAMVAGVVPLLLALQAGSLGLSTVVGLAFAVAASTFCPLLVLGIWWRGLTAVGAGAGLLVGGGLSGAAVLLTVLGPPLSGWPGALLAQPAAWTVPAAFAVMVLTSLATPGRVPADVGRTMVQLHAPERLRLQP